MIPLLLLTLGAPPATPDPLPPQAVLRLGPREFHLGNAGGHIAVSRDGQRIATTGPGGGVWRTSTGRPETRFEAPAGACIAYSPDGRTLAVGGYLDARQGAAPIFLIDAATGCETARLPGHREHVQFIAFAGDGTVVSGGEDRVFRVWDLRTATQVREFTRDRYFGHEPEAVSPNGQYLARLDRVGAGCVAVQVFDIASGRELLFEEMHTNVWSVAFAPDSRSVVCMGGAIYRYELPSGRPVRAWPRPPDIRGTLACSNDGPYFLTPEGKNLTAYDVAAGQTVDFPLRLPVCIAGQSAATTLWTWRHGTRLAVWDLTTGRPRHPTTGHTGPIFGVALTPTGQAITAERESVRRWDASGREENAWPCRSNTNVYDCTLAPDGRSFANGDGAGVIRIWDTATGQQKGSLPTTVSVGGGLAFSPDSSVFAAASYGLGVWDTTTLLKRWAASVHGRQVAATFSPDGRALFTGDQGGTIRQLDAASGKAIRLLGTDSDSLDQRRLIGWGLNTEKPHSGHTGRIIGLAISHDGRRLVSAGGDHTLRLWDLMTGKVCTVLDRAAGSQPYHDPSSYPIAVSADGAVLAAPRLEASHRHLIDLWDIRAGRRYATLEGHGGRVTALAFAPDGRRLISGGTDSLGLIWAVPRPTRPPEVATDPARVAELWTDLADADAAKAFRALGACLTMPDATVAAFRRLRPPPEPVDPDRVSSLIADLDSDQFAVREKASKELRVLGSAAGELLRRALGKSASAEVKRRIEEILATSADDDLRVTRAVEVLEAIGTPDARALLKGWAKGDPGAAQTREAAAALGRLGRR